MKKFALALGLLLAGCVTADDIDVQPKGEGRYDLKIENDFGIRTQGAERLLARKAEALCPDGYERLQRKSLYKRRGVTEHVLWEIECS